MVFTSTRTGTDDAGYDAMAVTMSALACQQDGFLAMTSVRDPSTRVGITVSYWSDDASAQAWRAVAEHAVAQRLGRERWYAEYQVTVARVTRAYAHPPGG